MLDPDTLRYAAVAISPDGRLAFAASSNGTVVFRGLDPL
jgi:hypothetical protein